MATFSPPTLPLEEGSLDECEIITRLAAIVAGHRPDADLDALAEQELHTALAGPADAAGVEVAALRAALSGTSHAERLLDLRLRTGPYGDRFGQVPDGLSLAKLRAHPHGVDLGPLRPRIPEI